MARNKTKITAVHVDIAQFVLEVGQVPDGELGGWTARLARCLAYRDPSIHEFGARLLAEAEEYMAEISERQRRRAVRRWHPEAAETMPDDANRCHGMPDDAAACRTMPTDAGHANTSLHSTSDKELRDSALKAPSPDLFRDSGKMAPGKNGSRPRKDAPATREPDPVWDVVAELFHFKPPHTAREAARIGAVVRDLRTMGADPEAVRRAYKTARSEWNGGPAFSPEALVKWFREFEGRARLRARRDQPCPKHGGYAHPCVECLVDFANRQ